MRARPALPLYAPCRPSLASGRLSCSEAHKPIAEALKQCEGLRLPCPHTGAMLPLRFRLALDGAAWLMAANTKGCAADVGKLAHTTANTSDINDPSLHLPSTTDRAFGEARLAVETWKTRVQHAERGTALSTPDAKRAAKRLLGQQAAAQNVAHRHEENRPVGARLSDYTLQLIDAEAEIKELRRKFDAAERRRYGRAR